MHFLNPIALLGLVASLAPLLVHLLYRGSARAVPFSNLAYLRRLHHRRMRRVQLRQWLVLLLRTLAIAAVVLAFARPAYRAGPGWWRGASVPVNGVVLIDQSLSTQQRLDGTTAFAQLQRRAVELTALFAARDRLTVLPYAQTPGEALAATDREQLRRRLLALEPTQAGTDVGAAVADAAAILRSLPPGDRELFVLSDLARGGWPDAGAAAIDVPAARVHVVAAGGVPAVNLGVTRVEVPDWMAAVGRRLTVVAVVDNGSSQDVEGVAVDLFVDGERVAQASVAVPAGGRQRVELAVTPRRPGRLTGYVEIAADAVAGDNRRFFVLYVPERIDVLVLGETPAAGYYVRQALEAAAGADPVLRVRSAGLDGLATLDPGAAPVVVLCNLNWLDRPGTAAVRGYVSRGGAALLIPGPRADLDYFNRELLPGLLPAQLGLAAGPGAAGFRRLDPDPPLHPLFADLLSARDQQDLRFQASFVVEAGPALAVLARFGDGGPALVEGRLGQGRTMLWAAPVDLDWTDLPVRGLWVPLWHRLVRELALPAQRHQQLVVGQQVLRPLAGLPVSSQVEAESPAGRRYRLEARPQDGEFFWRIPRADEAGIWRLDAAGGPIDRFAVNVDPRESDLRTVSLAELERLVGGEGLHLLGPGADLGGEVLRRRQGRELWRELVGLAVLLLAAELWLARAPRPSGAGAP